ncbi:cyclase family protein [Pseudooceanicola aestuarii]|uniref:cyclase family protein n=1 Tax=Pseudooceanicola aestuarii TaxID=2697319 RepID=UPI0013D6EF86|nr:cyclase family protein [Pseudooceanicola aestuarii]
MGTTRWKNRPEGSNWGDFGPDDQLGRLNLITAEKVRQGVAEVREGRSFCLSLPLDYPGGNALNPRRHPPILRPTLRADGVNFNATLGPAHTDVISDDLAILHLQYSTQWDALAHVGGLFDADDDGVPERVYYNGFRAEDDITGPQDLADAGVTGAMAPHSTSRAARLGIENIAAHGVQGRAVMIDLHAHLGRAPTAVGYDMLMPILEADGVTIETGDMLCFHTGFAQQLLEQNRKPDHDSLHRSCAALDGRDGALLNWITDCGAAALIADNYAVETHPARPGEAATCCAYLPLHEHCLFKNGIPLGELWHLTPLADHLRAQGRHRFLLTAPPLRLPGAVGSPVTPIATV